MATQVALAVAERLLRKNVDDADAVVAMVRAAPAALRDAGRAGAWALMSAVIERERDVVLALLDAGVPTEDSGISALEAAACANAPDMAQLLLDRGIGLQDGYLDNAIEAADEQANHAVAALLVRAAVARGPPATPESRATRLDAAAAAGAADAVAALLADRDVRLDTPLGRIPLGRALFDSALRFGRAEVLRVLLDAGADPVALGFAPQLDGPTCRRPPEDGPFFDAVDAGAADALALVLNKIGIKSSTLSRLADRAASKHRGDVLRVLFAAPSAAGAFGPGERLALAVESGDAALVRDVWAGGDRPAPDPARDIDPPGDLSGSEPVGFDATPSAATLGELRDVAVMDNNADVLAFLLSAAEHDREDINRLMDLAVLRGSDRALAALLAAGADPSACTTYNYITAHARGHANALLVLIDALKA